MIKPEDIFNLSLDEEGLPEGITVASVREFKESLLYKAFVSWALNSVEEARSVLENGDFKDGQRGEDVARGLARGFRLAAGYFDGLEGLLEGKAEEQRERDEAYANG